MKIQFLTCIVAGFVAGAISVWVWTQHESSEAREISRSWEIVDQFTKIMRGESTEHTSAQDGFMFVEYDVDPEPALALLVSKEELCYADLVFPNVKTSRDNNRVWMEFTYKHYPALLWVTGHSNMGQFKTAGDYPLHLNVWYKNTPHATELVKQLVQLMEDLALAQSK
ncbi:hypothetical protein [Rosistilla oblonga]|uniref:hypothetical protein n=1 Tax=Rosistilla oblonga TaxID=2527990 RepID=UPI003A970AC9